ncbi:hypothetical protein FOZ60_006075 [Perkinsus olseni]|uniref:Uncharacterized protein n=4 Tax=Perkinsus olseni TaxID=32597 RepID=A0A7J6NRW8_PEROL|nr:hypothetical protein FOZ60_006075 [Perkinsus olseni]
MSPAELAAKRQRVAHEEVAGKSLVDLDSTKSPNDKRQYRVVRLDNGIEAVLVQLPLDDELKTKAAMAVSVGVGSFTDPTEYPGLAHYLEHMLFMGSKKYPGENEFETYLSKNGGYSNAYTELEYTCYYFECTVSGFEKAVDMFSGFFTNPLMNPDSSERELEAVESEYRQTLNSDSARLEQLGCYLAKEDHIWKKFTWGNKKSLLQGGSDYGKLREALLQFYDRYYLSGRMRACMVGRMPLDDMEKQLRSSFSDVRAAPLAADPLATAVPEDITLEKKGFPLDVETLPYLIRVRPIKDIHRLQLQWQLPPQNGMYRTKPANTLGHLIGHEGSGSLLSFLRSKGLATDLSAGVSEEGYGSNSICSVFDICVTLSTRGLALWKEVVVHVMEYLDMLRRLGSIPDWVYDEIRQVSNMQYRFIEERDPSTTADDLSSSMLPAAKISYENLLNSTYFLEPEFKPKEVSELLNEYITSEKMLLVLTSSVFGRSKGTEEEDDDDCEEEQDEQDEQDDGEDSEDDDEEDEEMDEEDEDETPGETPEVMLEKMTKEMGLNIDGLVPEGPPEVEPWFGVEYWRTELDDEFKGRLAAPSVNDHLALPRKNVYIAKDFTVYDPSTSCSGLSGRVFPEMKDEAKDAPTVSVYEDFPVVPSDRQAPRMMVTRGDQFFYLPKTLVSATPRCDIRIRLTTPLFVNDITMFVQQRLWVELAKEALIEETYLAEMAGLATELTFAAQGLELRVYGFKDSLAALMKNVLEVILYLKKSEDLLLGRFGAIKEALERRFFNEDMRPIPCASAIRRMTLLSRGAMHRGLTKRALLQEKGVADNLDQILGDLDTTVKQHGVKAECLMLGNLDKEFVEEIESMVEAEMKAHAVQHLQPADFPYLQCLEIPLGHTVYLEETQDPTEQNSVLEAYYQCSPNNIRDRVLLDLLESVMEEPLFDTLRTKQQLGYSVFCGVRLTGGVLGYVVVVQSAVAGPATLWERIDAFLEEFRQSVLLEMSEDTFASHVVSLARSKLEPPRTLTEEATTMWCEVQESRYNWNGCIEESKELSGMKKEDLLDLYDRFFSKDKRRVFSVALAGSGSKYTYEAEQKSFQSMEGVTLADSVQEFRASSRYLENPSLQGRSE